MKKGDKVRIIIGPLDKVGKIGEIVNMFTNGAMIKLDGNKFTPIQFKHLEVIKNDKKA